MAALTSGQLFKKNSQKVKFGSGVCAVIIIWTNQADLYVRTEFVKRFTRL